MTMVLSGDGTVTGLVAGGLPDATVTQADLATIVTPLGVGQTWQDVKTTPGRVTGSTYTNTSGRPIVIHAVMSNASGGTGYMTVVVGGVTLNSPSTVTGGYAQLQAVVPEGSTYLVPTIASWTLIQWVELRA